MRYILLSLLLTCSALAQPYWSTLNGPSYAFDPRDIAVANNGVMYTIGGANREIVKSTNQGDTWTSLASPEDSVFAIGVKPDDDQTIIIGLESGAVRRSTNGGSSWATVILAGTLTARANRIVFRPNSTSFALLGTAEGGDNDDHLYKTTDAGANWSVVTNFTFETTVTDIVFNPLTPDTVYVTGASEGGSAYLTEGVWRSTNGGTSWQSKITGIGSNIDVASITVDPSDRYTLYACTYSGTWKIYKNTTTGISWSATTPADATPGGRTIRAHSSSTILIATTKGMWQTTNSGSSWGTITTVGLYETASKWLAQYVSGGTTYYFLGTTGTFFRSTDVGVNWIDKCNGMAKLPTTSVAIQSSATIFALPTTGYVKSLLQRTTNTGTDWYNVLGDTVGISATWEGRDVATNSSYVVASGEETGGAGPVILVSTNSGTGWQRKYNPAGNGAANGIGLDPNDNQKFYVAAQNASNSPTGGVYKTTDGGQNWAWKGITAGEFLCVIVDPNNSSILYAGGISLGVYKSTNGGDSWTSASTGMGSLTVNSLTINPLTGLSDTLYAGTATGGVYRSVDAAANWTQLTSATPSTGSNVSNVLLHPQNTSVLYASGVDGGTPFLSKVPLASSTAVDRDETGGLPAGATINKVIVNPYVKYKLLAATSSGIYTKVHQWQGKSEANINWNDEDSVQLGFWHVDGESHGGDFTLVANDTLTIEAGTIVKFMANADGSDGANLTINGYIYAQGTGGDKIYFQPHDLTKLAGGLDVQYTGVTSLKYCDFYRMTVGVYFAYYTTNPGRVDYCTFRECSSIGLGYYDVDLPSPAIVATHNTIVNSSTGIYCYYSDIGIDSCNISTGSNGVWVYGGSPGFRGNNIDSNSSYGVRCSNGASPKFGGYLGTEAGYNFIGENGSYEVFADGASPFFGDGSSGGINHIYDNVVGYRVYAVNSSTISAQYTSWGDTCTTSSSKFYADGTSSIDYTNRIPFTPTLVSPANGATGVARNTQFIWNTATGAILYRLQIATDVGFTSITDDLININDTTYTKGTALAANTTYYWRILSIQANHYPNMSNSCWSTIRSFTTGSSKLVMDEENPLNGIPTEYNLSQNHPNPFNPTTEIRYGLPEDQFVSLKVYDMLGREVMELANEYQSAGYKVVRFDAGTLPSGVYIYRLHAGTFNEMKKMVLTK